jgi:putative phosphoesterase
MKILIVSDTHGRCYYLEKTIARVKPIDMLIHLGDFEGDEAYIKALADCPTEMVSGNNDFFSSLPRESFIQIGKYYVMLTHGHRYGVNSGVAHLKEVALCEGADIVLFGHTHVPMIDLSDDKIFAVNPGSITQPRQAGRVPTYIIMEIDRKGEVHFTLNYIGDDMYEDDSVNY